jgi:hypothetical protein
MEREEQSARGALKTQQYEGRIQQLELENQQLRETVVGLGRLVAAAAAAGGIEATRNKQ